MIMIIMYDLLTEMENSHLKENIFCVFIHYILCCMVKKKNNEEGYLVILCNFPATCH